MNNPFFRIPDWRTQLVMPPTELFVDGPAIPFRMKLAPPRSAIDVARALTPAESLLWIPSRIARPGDVVTVGNFVVMPDGENAWVFFCDDMPGMYFGHRCRYFVIDDVGGAIRVVDATAPPQEKRDDVSYIPDRPGYRPLFL